MPKKSKEKSEDLYKPYQHIGLPILYGLLFLFLIANILFSQRIPDMYFSLANNDPNALVSFLKNAKSERFFYKLYPEVQKTFAQNDADIFQDERQTTALIGKLEALLQQNPSSRDILYSLSLLYKKNGDEDRAAEYLQRAREVDPMIGI